MKLSRPSIICLGLSVLSTLALLVSDQLVEATGYAHVVLIAQLSLGVSLFAAMLLHVRFVSHVNPNPPEPKKALPTPNAQAPSPAKPQSFSKPTAAKPSRSAVPAPKAAEIHDQYSDPEEEEVARPRRSKRRVRVDGPEPNSLKGMSKKQRKLARKEFRERQRAMQQGHEM